MSVVKCDNPLLEYVTSHLSDYPNIANLPIVQWVPMCLELDRLTTGGDEKLKALADALESMASIILQNKRVA